MQRDAVKLRATMFLVCIAFVPACAPSHSIEDVLSEQTRSDGRSVDAGMQSPIDGRDGPVRDVQFAPFDAVPSEIVGAFGACNTLRTTALPIEETRVRGEPPAARGGTVVNGWYVLTSAVIYTTGLEDAGDIDAGLDAADPDAFSGDDVSGETGRGDVTVFTDISFSRNGRQEAMLVSDGSVYRISRRGTEPAITTNFSWMTSGTRVTTTVFCPPGATLGIDGYDAMPTRIVLHDSTARRVDTFDRQ
jgi:hypothetical protein